MDFKLLLKQATAEYKNRNYNKVLDILNVPFEKALKDSLIDNYFLLELAFLILKSHYGNKDWDAAISFGLNHIKLASSVSRNQNKITPYYYYNLAKSYAKIGDFNNSLVHHSLVCDFFTKFVSEDCNDLIYPYIDIGIDLSYLNRPFESIEYFIKAIHVILNQQEIEHLNIPNLLSVICDRYVEIDNKEKTELYKKLHQLSIRKPLNSDFYQILKKEIKRNLSEFYQLKSHNHRQKENFSEAIFFNLKSLELYKESYASDTELITLMNNTGQLYSSINNLDFALNYYVEAYNLIEKNRLGNQLIASAVYNNLGSIFFELKDFDKANFFYVLDASILKKIKGDNCPELGMAYNNLSLIFREEGDTKQALEYAEEAKKIYLDVYGKKHSRYGNLLNNLGTIHYENGNYHKSIKNFEEALNIYSEVFDYTTQNILYTQENLASAYYLNGQKELAYSLIKKKVEQQNEFLGKHFFQMQPSLKEKFFYYSKTSLNILNTILHTKKKLTNKDQIDAYNINVMYKKILFHSECKLRNLIANSADAELEKLYRELYFVRMKLYELSFGENNLSKTSLIDLSLNQQKIESEISHRNSTIHAIYSSHTIDFHSIRNSLLPSQAIIEFVNFERYTNNKTKTDSYHNLVYIIKKDWDTPIIIQLYTDSELLGVLNKSDNILPSIQFKKMYTYELNGKDLYNLIWTPIEEHLKDVKSIFLSTAGLISKIAIPSLPRMRKELLSDKYDFHYISSTIDILTKSATLNKDDLKSIIFFSGINYDDFDENSEENLDYKPNYAGFKYDDKTWKRLPAFSQISTTYEYLKSFITNPMMVSGKDATKERFFRLNEKSPNIIHLYTHGFYCQLPNTRKEKKSNKFNTYRDHKNPLYRTGLIIAGGNIGWKNGTNQGVLTAFEILQMDLSNTKLCVLGACGTGLGDIMDYEGVFGLVRAFKIAGVKNIIMSLWAVTDLHTKLFFEYFYQNLSYGKSIRHSFYDAQSKMRFEFPLRPDLWAAFILLE